MSEFPLLQPLSQIINNHTVHKMTGFFKGVNKNRRIIRQTRIVFKHNDFQASIELLMIFRSIVKQFSTTN